MLVVGIDPGKTGAVSIVDVTDKVSILKSYWLGDCKSDLGIVEVFKSIKWKSIDAVAIESVHAMPRQGVSSMFKFGESFGGLKMLAIREMSKVHALSPQTWMRPFSIGIPKSLKGKHRNKFMLDRICPNHGLKRDGEWDSVLIAVACCLILTNTTITVGDYTTLGKSVDVDFSRVFWGRR